MWQAWWIWFGASLGLALLPLPKGSFASHKSEPSENVASRNSSGGFPQFRAGQGRVLLLQNRLVNHFWKESLPKNVAKVGVLAGSVMKKQQSIAPGAALLIKRGSVPPTQACKAFLEGELAQNCRNGRGSSWACYEKVKQHCCRAALLVTVRGCCSKAGL